MVKSDWLGFGKHRKKIGLIRAKSSLILINKLIFRLIEEKILVSTFHPNKSNIVIIIINFMFNKIYLVIFEKLIILWS